MVTVPAAAAELQRAVGDEQHPAGRGGRRGRAAAQEHAPVGAQLVRSASVQERVADRRAGAPLQGAVDEGDEPALGVPGDLALHDPGGRVRPGDEDALAPGRQGRHGDPHPAALRDLEARGGARRAADRDQPGQPVDHQRRVLVGVARPGSGGARGGRRPRRPQDPAGLPGTHLGGEHEVLRVGVGADDPQLLVRRAHLELEVGHVGADGRAVGADLAGHRVDELDLQAGAQGALGVGDLEVDVPVPEVLLERAGVVVVEEVRADPRDRHRRGGVRGQPGVVAVRVVRRGPAPLVREHALGAGVLELHAERLPVGAEVRLVRLQDDPAGGVVDPGAAGGPARRRRLHQQGARVGGGAHLEVVVEHGSGGRGGRRRRAGEGQPPRAGRRPWPRSRRRGRRRRRGGRRDASGRERRAARRSRA